MAAIVVTETVRNYRADLEKRSPQRLAEAVWPTSGQSGAGLKAQQTVLGEPDFIVYGTTDTNTADSDAINLSDEGVTFPDGHARMIWVRAYVADDNGMGVVEAKAIVDGGTTPIVVQDAASADPLVSGLAGTPAIDIEVATNEVIIEAVGITDVDCRWVIEVRVGDLVRLPYIATT